MIYAKLLLIFITTKIINVARSYAWIKNKREVSFYQAAKHLRIVYNDWLNAIIKQHNEIKNIIKNSIDFIVAKCLKGKSKKRIYPLQILNMIGIMSLA